MFTHTVHKNPTGKELEQIRTHGYLVGYPALFLWLRIKFVAKDQYQARTNLVLKKYVWYELISKNRLNRSTSSKYV